MFLAFIFSFNLWAQEVSIFKDLRTYYKACGIIGKDDPKFAGCNPPNMSQIMANFQRDPKNVEDMKKISRFHMTHSLQVPAKLSLVAIYSAFKKEFSDKKTYPSDLKRFKTAWEYNTKFVIILSPACRPQAATSLEIGQNLNLKEQELNTIKDTIPKLATHPCRDPKKGFYAFAVGVVDPTGKPDVWMIDEKNQTKQVMSSTERTPFD